MDHVKPKSNPPPPDQVHSPLSKVVKGQDYQDPADLHRVLNPVGNADAPRLVKPDTSVEAYERKAGNWIRAYMEYTKESESPDTYHLWCALCGLSAVLRRNVWVDQNLYVLYPNLYVALVGPPGRTAKSTALYLNKQILGQVPGIKMGPDSCTREQLIKAMAEAKLNNQCAMTIYSTEFSSLIGPSGILMIQFLLDIFDGNYSDAKTGWQYQTKHQGKDQIINPNLTGLFCTTPTYLAESIPDNVVGHGFTSRMIFVHEDHERLINSRPKPMDMELAASLVSDLRHISHLSGELRWEDQEAMDTYDRFYEGLYTDLPEDHRLEGYHWRKKIHVLKVAMLLSIANDDSLVIHAHDITAAVQFLHDLEHNMSRVFSAVGKYDYAVDAERIGTFIRSKGKDGIESGEVYQKFYHVGGDELAKIIVLLQRMRVIEVRPIGGKEMIYPKGLLPWA